MAENIQIELDRLVVRLYEQFNSLLLERGNLEDLTTTETSSLVSSINELKGRLDLIDSPASIINDSANIGTTIVWSVEKVKGYIDNLYSSIFNGVHEEYNSISKIVNVLEDIINSVESKVSYDKADNKTEDEKSQARDNIGAVGDEELQLVSDLVTTLSNNVGDTSEDLRIAFEEELALGQCEITPPGPSTEASKASLQKSIVWTPITPAISETITLLKDWDTSPDLESERDIVIPGIIELTHESGELLFNYASESEADTFDYLSPLGVEWTPGPLSAETLNAEFSNLDLAFANTYGIVANYLEDYSGTTWTAKIPSTNQYFQLTFSDMKSPNAGEVIEKGGYTRSELYEETYFLENSGFVVFNYVDGSISTRDFYDSSNNAIEEPTGWTLKTSQDNKTLVLNLDISVVYTESETAEESESQAVANYINSLTTPLKISEDENLYINATFSVGSSQAEDPGDYTGIIIGTPGGL